MTMQNELDTLRTGLKDELTQEFQKRLDASVLTEEQKAQYKAFVKEQFENSETIAELEGKFKELGDNIQANIDATEERMVKLEKQKWSENEDRMRLQSKGVWGGITLEEVPGYQFEISRSKGNLKQEKFESLQTAVRETGKVVAKNREFIDAHYDAIDKRLQAKGAKLDATLLSARDQALGRTDVGIDLANDSRTFAISTTTDGGGNLLQTAVDSNLWGETLISSDILRALPTRVLTSLDNRINYPQAELYTMFRRSAGEATAQSESTGGFGQVSIRAHEARTHRKITQQMIEDSVNNIVQDFMNIVPQAIQYAYEDAVINGDTNTTAASNVNGDAYVATGEPEMPYIGFNGLRDYADASSARQVNAGGALAASHLSGARRGLGMAGVDPAGHFFLTSVDGYDAMRQIPEFGRYDQLAMSAVYLTGALPNVGRAPVLVSPVFPQKVGDNGRVSITASRSADNKLAVLCVNPNACIIGMRIQPQVVVSYLNNSETNPLGWALIVRLRFGFAVRGGLDENRGRLANNGAVVVVRNITAPA